VPHGCGNFLEIAKVLADDRHRHNSSGQRASVRRKLSSLSSLFDYLCNKNAVAGNPVDGVERPESNGNEGSTPALGDAQVSISVKT
jgi:site-specific recombinase XerC